MKRTHISLSAIAPILFLLMWSSGAVMVKVGLQYSSEWSFLAARSMLSFVCLLLILSVMATRGKLAFTRLSLSEFKSIAIVGLMLQVFYVTFYILAIGSGMSPALVTIVLGLQPMLTPLMGKQPLDTIKTSLLVLGFIGLCIAILGAKSIESVSGIVIVFAVLTLISMTYGTIKQAHIHTNPAQAMLYQSMFSMPIFIAIALSTGWQITWSTGFIVSLLWMSIVVSVGALFLLLYMIKSENADSVSVLFYAVPLLAYLFNFILFGETLSLFTLCGMGIVAISIVLYRKRNARPVEVSESRA